MDRSKDRSKDMRKQGRMPPEEVAKLVAEYRGPITKLPPGPMAFVDMDKLAAMLKPELSETDKLDALMKRLRKQA
jgi:hypothetical protein